MKLHPHTFHTRIIRAALRVTGCRYRVVAIGLDYRGKPIAITTNSPRLPLRGMHAEERLMHVSPRSLARIIIARVGADGMLLPIDPCEHCAKLASKRGVKITRYEGE